MSTILDYEKTNKFLPQSLRDFVGASNRMMRQNFNQFIYMYEGLEQMAVFTIDLQQSSHLALMT